MRVLRRERELGATLDVEPAHLRSMIEAGRQQAIAWVAHSRSQPAASLKSPLAPPK